MTQRTFTGVAGLLFLLGSLLHAARLLFQWNAVIAGWVVPLWLSIVAMILAGFMAYSAWTLRR